MSTKSEAWWRQRVEKFHLEGRSRTADNGLYFDDEFGPSHSITAREISEKGVNNRMRAVLQNNHVFDFLGIAIERAQELGADPIVYDFPSKFTKVDSAESVATLLRARSIIDGLPAESPDRLAVTCYIQWLVACVCATKDEPILRAAEWAFRAGATARELELSIINRSHASRGRKTIKGSSKAGEQKRGKFKRDTETVLERMQLLVEQDHSVSRAAELAKGRGLGQSKSANERLWYRHKK